jgi:dephospho-CoA kinase
MIFVGIAGPSGSGKSTLCNFFIESGCDVYNLDKVAKRFYPDAAEQIKNEFGPETIDERGSVNSNVLAKIVFADPEQMAKLNAIMIPHIGKFFYALCGEDGGKMMQNEGRVVVFDAAVIYETNWVAAIDYMIFVDAPLDVRVQRLMQGRKIPEDVAKMQAGAFNYSKVKLRKQDVKINNVGDSSTAIDKLKLWLEEIRKPQYSEDKNERYTGWSGLAV